MHYDPFLHYPKRFSFFKKDNCGKMLFLVAKKGGKRLVDAMGTNATILLDIINF